jgi:hypothetical protein
VSYNETLEKTTQEHIVNRSAYQTR